MSRTRNALRIAFAAAFGAVCLLASERATVLKDGSLTTSAEARIGRPLTPMSYAGVARRTTARAVTYGAAASTAAAAARRCVQAVDPYGRIYTRCY
jgi:hypothetical protein